jgi:hypothetical protein
MSPLCSLYFPVFTIELKHDIKILKTNDVDRYEDVDDNTKTRKSRRVSFSSRIQVK